MATTDKPSDEHYFNNATGRWNKLTAECLETTTRSVGDSNYHLMSLKASAYLDKLIMSLTPERIAKMRDYATKQELAIPMEEYVSDASLKEYLYGEVVELAFNYARDKDSHGIITLKGIKFVVKEDPDLNILLNWKKTLHEKWINTVL